MTGMSPKERSAMGAMPRGLLEEPLHVSVAIGMKGRSLWKGHRRTPSPTLELPPSTRESAAKSGNRIRAPTRSTARLVAILALICSSVMWLYLGLQSVTPSPVSNRHCKQEKTSRVLTDREMCTSLLPTSVKSDGSWLIGVHIHRSYVAQTRHVLRGTKPPRELPHLYFVQAVEATLRAISLVEPSSKVNIAVFTNGRWSSIVDDTGVPFTWDIPAHICKELGLSCTQDLVLMNDDTKNTADAATCLASADVMVGSEDEFSRAAVSLSSNVKILTDNWEYDGDEHMLVLNPAATIAGLPGAKRDALKQLVRDWRECDQSRRAYA